MENIGMLLVKLEVPSDSSETLSLYMAHWICKNKRTHYLQKHANNIYLQHIPSSKGKQSTNFIKVSGKELELKSPEDRMQVAIL
jgi:hypothetical protein